MNPAERPITLARLLGGMGAQVSRDQPQSAAEFLASYSDSRKASTVGYEERRRAEGQNKHGVAYGLLEYFHMLNRIPTIEWVVVMPRTQLSNVYCNACTTAASSARHLAIFYEFLNSISLVPHLGQC